MTKKKKKNINMKIKKSQTAWCANKKKKKDIQWVAVLQEEAPCWWKRSEENCQTYLSVQEGYSSFHNHSLLLCWADKHHIKAWGEWATTAESTSHYSPVSQEQESEDSPETDSA